ncbi:hypothetical protein [Nocardioides pacificus]
MTNSNFTREIWKGIGDGPQPGGGGSSLRRRWRRVLSRLRGRRAR